MIHVFAYADPWDWLNAITSGQIIKTILDVMEYNLGYWFYAILGFTFLGMIYLKTESAGTTSMIALLLGAIFRILLPAPAHTFAYLMIALGITGLLYKVFSS